MSVFWMLVIVIALSSSVLVWLFNCLLFRMKSVICRFVVQLFIVWICILLPIAGIYAIHGHYKNYIFCGARGLAVAVLLFCIFISHIIYLSKKEKELKKRDGLRLHEPDDFSNTDR